MSARSPAAKRQRESTGQTPEAKRQRETTAPSPLANRQREITDVQDMPQASQPVPGGVLGRVLRPPGVFPCDANHPLASIAWRRPGKGEQVKPRDITRKVEQAQRVLEQCCKKVDVVATAVMIQIKEVRKIRDGMHRAIERNEEAGTLVEEMCGEAFDSPPPSDCESTNTPTTSTRKALEDLHRDAHCCRETVLSGQRNEQKQDAQPKSRKRKLTSMKRKEEAKKRPDINALANRMRLLTKTAHQCSL